MKNPKIATHRKRIDVTAYSLFLSVSVLCVSYRVSYVSHYVLSVSYVCPIASRIYVLSDSNHIMS